MAIFDITYVGDMPYLKLEGGTVTGATTFTNNIAASTINGVTVGSSPKFTDTTYSVATTSASGLLPALGGGTTNYLRADGSWATPVGTTYSVATTSANGLMAAADKVAVNKIGSGTLNTTNKTIIPAINELQTTVNNNSSYIKSDKIILRATGSSTNTITLSGLTSVKGLFSIEAKELTSGYNLIRTKTTTSYNTSTVSIESTPLGQYSSSYNYYFPWVTGPTNCQILSFHLTATPLVGDFKKSGFTGYPGAMYNAVWSSSSDYTTYYPIKVAYPYLSFGANGNLYTIQAQVGTPNSFPLIFLSMPYNGTDIAGQKAVYSRDSATITMDVNNPNTAEIALYITYI